MELPNLTSNQTNLATFSTLNLQHFCSQLIKLSNKLKQLPNTHLSNSNLCNSLIDISAQTNTLFTQLEESSLNSSRWQYHLPDEILEIIYKWLDTINDYNRMLDVCKSWRSALLSLKPIPFTKIKPGLRFHTREFTISLHAWYTPPYIIQQHEFYLHYDAENRLRLAKLSRWPTSTLTFIDLNLISPRLVTRENQQHLLSTRVLEVSRCYHLVYSTSHREGWSDGPIKKISMLSETATRSIDVVLLGLRLDGSLAGWDAITKLWCQVEAKTEIGDLDIDTKFVDVISYRNNFYAIDSEVQLYKVYHANWLLEKPTKPPSQINFGEQSVLILLESYGYLYLLRRYLKNKLNSLPSYDDWIEVYVLDENSGEWKLVEELRDRIFVVVYNHIPVHKGTLRFLYPLRICDGIPVSVTASWSPKSSNPLFFLKRRHQVLKKSQTTNRSAKDDSKPMIAKRLNEDTQNDNPHDCCYDNDQYDTEEDEIKLRRIKRSAKKKRSKIQRKCHYKRGQLERRGRNPKRLSKLDIQLLFESISSCAYW